MSSLAGSQEATYQPSRPLTSAYGSTTRSETARRCGSAETPELPRSRTAASARYYAEKATWPIRDAVRPAIPVKTLCLLRDPRVRAAYLGEEGIS